MITVNAQDILALRAQIDREFSEENWLELGLFIDEVAYIKGHNRLLRSLSWDDPDYPKCILEFLSYLREKHPEKIHDVGKYVKEKFYSNDMIADVVANSRSKYNANVITYPDKPSDYKYISVMMPFAPQFSPVYKSIKDAAKSVPLEVIRADEVWNEHTVIQDIINIIYDSAIVICDLTGKNSNVFYEMGVSHALGRHVIPIAQNINDIPFDIQHHRFLQYLPNSEGMLEMTEKLELRIKNLCEKMEIL